MKINFAKAKALHLKIGKKGEELTCRYLQNIGCKILLKNFKFNKDEIDIIALDGRTICFVEVKTRKAPIKARPSSGLTEGQKKRIRRAATHYLSSINNPLLPYRFDLAEVVLSNFDVVEFRYWKNNFGNK